MAEKFLEIAEVAEMLHLSKCYVGQLINKTPSLGGIPAYKFGRRKVVKEADLLKWIEENKIGKEQK